ncbi:hypothetical protein [Paraliomyxa miuraensis]|uniref:hypothetical protein n=1 Tax=Paraliomyxa miuraensis TaxID=376150 RepID=UPI0022599CCE|nr:hypothetical protein [Paraliomyxa miuraensis]MCX4240496.1 hypothetical protein [Paraliomyxa miuraensis]
MTPLDKLRTALGAIAPFEVVEPSVLIDVLLADAERLHRRLSPSARWPRRLGRGGSANARDELLTAMAAAREAHDQWVELREHDDIRLERVRAAVALREEIMMACLRSVQHEPDALAMAMMDEVEEIARGCEVADLVADLERLAGLLERHRAAFEVTDGFDARTRARSARRLAHELAASLAEPTPETAQAERDRAYTYLVSLISDLAG